MGNIKTYSDYVNEADEVSVDKILTAVEKKALKTAFETAVIGIDKIAFKRDGTIVAKRGYFYRHGASPTTVADALVKQLRDEGIEIKVIDKYDDYKPWPKDSNFVVEFKVESVK